MTINLSDNSPRISYSVAEGVTQTSFTVPFEFFDNDDLNVYVDGVLKTLTTDYTVSGGDGSTGTVTISVTGASGGSTVVITRDIDLERTTDFPTSGPFQIAALNTELDRITAIAADLNDLASRAIAPPDYDPTVSYTLPVVDDRKGKTLAFNATTGAVEAGPSTSDVQSVSDTAADIALLADIEDGTLATNAITNVNTIRTDVSTVSGISGNVTTVANNDANVTTVATDLNGSDTIGTVAGSIANVNLTGPSITSVNTVAGSITNVNTTATNIADVNTVAGVSTDVSTVAGISSNVSTVSGISANVTTVAGISSNVTTVAGISGNVTTVAGQTTNLQNVTDNLTAIQNAATNATNAATSASNAATSATAAAASQAAAAASAASAASSYDSFDDRYLGVKASDPTLDNDGDPLSSGLLYFSSSENIMKVYDGASWIAATSAGNVSLTTYQYTATGGQTTFSGSDDNAATLTYTVNNILVTLNGSLLFNGTDYTATNGTSIVLSSGATASDVLQVTAFASFTTADMVPASTGGTFSGNVAVTGDLTVDTNTLYVDSTNNNVGIGTTSPASELHVTGSAYTPITIDGTSGATIDFYRNGSRHAQIFTDNTGGDIVFRNNTTTERMRINSSGDVAISGDLTGLRYFDVYNTGSTSTDGAIVRLITEQVGSTSTTSADIIKRKNGEFRITNFETDASAYIAFNVGSSERMRIDSSGNVGIKTTSPDQALNIGFSGADQSNAIRIEGSNGASERYALDIVADGENGRAEFKVGQGGGAPTTQFMIHPDGGICFGTDTAAANALDDYEEGTWTPTLPNGGTISVSRASYIKIGRLVHVQFQADITPTNNSNQFRIGGLPFITTSAASSYSVGSLGYSGGLDVSGWNQPIVQHNGGNYLYFQLSTASVLSIANSAFAGSTRNFVISANYEANA